MTNTVALVVNAGGQSRRMGQNKALLPVPHDDLPLIVWIVKRLQRLMSEHVIVVTNDPVVTTTLAETLADAGAGRLQIVADQWAAGGALGGVATALAACTGWAMVVACDMPLLEPDVFATLIEAAAKYEQEGAHFDAIIPQVGGQAQPFHGLWHPRCLPVLAARLGAGQLGVQDALAALRVQWVGAEALGLDAASLAFTNVNTPEEWAAVAKILAERNRPAAI